MRSLRSRLHQLLYVNIIEAGVAQLVEQRTCNAISDISQILHLIGLFLFYKEFHVFGFPLDSIIYNHF